MKVWYHVYASPVHPEMCDNWLLKAYSNFTIVWEACCLHLKHEMDNHNCLGCTVSTDSELPGLSLLNTGCQAKTLPLAGGRIVLSLLETVYYLQLQTRVA